MNTRHKIQVFLISSDSDRKPLFLVLKQIASRGGQWQPITGSVNEGESFEQAARREVLEETGLEQVSEFVDTHYSFDFTSQARGGLTMREHVFGSFVDHASPIRLSWEHTDYEWVSKVDALKTYLYWQENKNGLMAVCRVMGL